MNNMKPLQKKFFDTFYVLENGNGNFWNAMVCKWALTEEQIEMIFNWVQPSFVSQYQELSENFMRKHADKLDWFKLSIHQKFSEQFAREFQDRVFWVAMAENQHFNKDFKREFAEELDWKKKI